jgi:hypothetical protein
MKLNKKNMSVAAGVATIGASLAFLAVRSSPQPSANLPLRWPEGVDGTFQFGVQATTNLTEPRTWVDVDSWREGEFLVINYNPEWKNAFFRGVARK